MFVSAVLSIIPFDILFFNMGSVIATNLDTLKGRYMAAIKSRNVEEIKRTIDVHNQTIDCFNRLKSLYTLTILNKCMYIAILICTTGFQIIVVRLNGNLKLEVSTKNYF